jgi:hypothetical protein
VGILVLAVLFLVGVGEVCCGWESSKRRDAVWSGDEVVDGDMDMSVGVWSTHSVSSALVGTDCIGSEVSSIAGSEAVVMLLSMALTWFCQAYVPAFRGVEWCLLNFLYLFFLGSTAAAAGPLVSATRAVVEVLSFWAGAADMGCLWGAMVDSYGDSWLE